MDLSQIELRVPAVFSGEATLIDAYNNNWDLHTRTAVSLFGKEELLSRYPDLAAVTIDLWKEANEVYDKNERLLGKTTNFASGYWAGPKRMQATALTDMGLLLPIAFFRKVVDTRRELRPQLYAWQEAHLREVTRRGYSCLPITGQTRNFEGYSYDRHLDKGRRDEDSGKDQTSEVLNHPVQTTAANVLHRIAAALNHRLPNLSGVNPPCYCYANVYDALVFDCKRSWLPELKGYIDEAVKYVEHKEYWAMLASHYGNFVPLAYEMKVSGDN